MRWHIGVTLHASAPEILRSYMQGSIRENQGVSYGQVSTMLSLMITQ